MPQRPDGQAARPQRVTFTKGSAERIAAVVRDYEAGDRSALPLRFGVVSSDSQKTFRIATFSGAWSPNSTKTVEIVLTGQTVNAFNRTFPLSSVPANNEIACSIAKDGTAWHLVDVGKNQSFGHLFAGGITTRTVVTDMLIAATLNTTNCAITVTKTPVTATVTIVFSTYTASFLSLAGMTYQPGV
jgi:hypothetical protein